MRLWPWVAFLFIAGAGAGGYWVLESEGGTAEARDELIAIIDRMRLSDRWASGVDLTPLSPPDTTVSAGSWVEVAVKVRSADGAPLADTAVHFAVDDGPGTLVAAATWTDRDGVARTSVRMPDEVGLVVVRASLAGGPGGVQTRFTLQAGGGERSRMEYLAGDGQEAAAGEELRDPFTVVVLDENGQPMPGVEVRFEVAGGDGAVSPERTRTDDEGRAAAVWRLGPRAGFHRLIARSSTTDTPVTFTAMATVPGAAPAGANGFAAEQVGGVPPADGQAASEAPDPFVANGDPGAGRPPSNVAAPPLPSGPDLVPGPVTVRSEQLAVSGSAVCTTGSGGLMCFGEGAGEEGSALAGSPAAVAAGLFHICALDARGRATCWGANDSGQLGDASRSDRPLPTEVATEFGFSQLAAGAAHTCGLTSGGRALCWGQNVGGQLGDGTREDRATPGAVLPAIAFDRLVAGWSHTCGLTPAGTAYCWGLNRVGQIGDGSRVDRLEPREVIRSVRSMTAGSDHTCAISEGEVLCWGDNRSGQLGNGSREPRLRPAAVDVPGLPVQVAAGAAHTCALLADGAAYCWGQNRHGQLGDGSAQGTLRPVPVSGGHVFRSLVAGGAVTCGRTEGGDLLCWGLNQSGQLGDGTFTNRSVPTPTSAGASSR